MNLNCLWGPPPADLVLSSDEIHVWCASLDQSASRLPWLTQTLSTDERMRAERFYFEQDRNRFTVGRGVLRTILSGYLGIEPCRLQFCYGSYGKPALVGRSGWSTLHFNVSHSQRLVLYTVTRAREIGVDLERVRLLADVEQIVERFFSPREKAVFRALPSSKKPLAFFNCWTRKEAYIKASGDGLARSLDQIEVSLAPGEPARLLRIEGDPQEASRWSLEELTPAPGYVAALAVETGGWHLACWRWPATWDQ